MFRPLERLLSGLFYPLGALKGPSGALNGVYLPFRATYLGRIHPSRTQYGAYLPFRCPMGDVSTLQGPKMGSICPSGALFGAYPMHATTGRKALVGLRKGQVQGEKSVCAPRQEGKQ